MHPNATLIQHFYTAFQNRDYLTMQRAYHADATFYDPVFLHLNANEARAMWQMLLTSAKDLRVTCHDIRANDAEGSCTWEARYTFSKTGRPVHNIIRATFAFREGRMVRHHDAFNFWRWSRQALGASGWLLGWSPVVQKKVRGSARENLTKFMQKNFPG